MPKKDDEAGRRARARRLRMQIEQLKKGSTSGTARGASRAPSESPREFVERRMREIAAGERAKTKPRARATKRSGPAAKARKGSGKASKHAR